MASHALGPINVTKYNNYKQLSRSRSEIRLLEILPAGSLGDELKCRLVNAKPTQEFIGLSVLPATGDTTREETIVLDSRHHIKISADLGDAMRHMREVFLQPDPSATPAWLTHLLKGVRTILPETRQNKRAAKLRVWAAEVCINKYDPQEQATRHQHMRLVYKSAKMVVGWLGPRDETSDTAVEIIRMIDRAMPANYGHPDDKANHPENYAPRCEWLADYKWFWDIPEGVEPTDALIYRSMCEFMKRPYLQADWALQEISMAAYPAFLIGDKIISWMQILRYLRNNEDLVDNGATMFPDEFRELIKFLPLGPMYTLLKEFETRRMGSSDSNRRVYQSEDPPITAGGHSRHVESATPIACAATSSDSVSNMSC